MESMMYPLRVLTIVLNYIVYFLYFSSYAYAASFPEYLTFTTEQYSFWEARYKTALVLWLEPQDGFYLYAHSEAKSGLPTTITLMEKSKEYHDTVDILYPQGVMTRDLQDPSKHVEVYNKKVPIVIILPAHTIGEKLNIRTEGLLCAVGKCIPVRTISNIAVGNPEQLEDVTKQPWFSMVQPELQKIRNTFPNRAEWMDSERPKRVENTLVLAKKSFFDYRPKNPESFVMRGDKKVLIVPEDKIEVVRSWGKKQEFVTLPDGRKEEVVSVDGNKGILLPDSKNETEEFIEIGITSEPKRKLTFPTFKIGEFFTDKVLEDEGEEFVNHDIPDTKIFFYKDEESKEPTQSIIVAEKKKEKPKPRPQPKKQPIAKAKPQPKPKPSSPPKFIEDDVYIEPERHFSNIKNPNHRPIGTRPKTQIVIEQAPLPIANEMQVLDNVVRNTIKEQIASKQKPPGRRPKQSITIVESKRPSTSPIQRPQHVVQNTAQRLPQRIIEDMIEQELNSRTTAKQPHNIGGMRRPQQPIRIPHQSSLQGGQQVRPPRVQGVKRPSSNTPINEDLISNPVTLYPYPVKSQQKVTGQKIVKREEQRSRLLSKRQMTAKEQAVARYFIEEQYLPSPEEVLSYTAKLPHNPTKQQVAEIIATPRAPLKQSQRGKVLGVAEKKAASYYIEQNYLPTPEQIVQYTAPILEKKAPQTQRVEAPIREVQPSHLSKEEREIARYLVEQEYLASPERIKEYVSQLPANPTSQQITHIVQENMPLVRNITPREQERAKSVIESGYLPELDELYEYTSKFPVQGRETTTGSVVKHTDIPLRNLQEREVEIARYLIDRGYLATPEELHDYAQQFPLYPTVMQKGRRPTQLSAPIRNITVTEGQRAHYLIDRGYLPEKDTLYHYDIDDIVKKKGNRYSFLNTYDNFLLLDYYRSQRFPQKTGESIARAQHTNIALLKRLSTYHMQHAWDMRYNQPVYTPHTGFSIYQYGDTLHLKLLAPLYIELANKYGYHNDTLSQLASQNEKAFSIDSIEQHILAYIMNKKQEKGASYIPKKYEKQISIYSNFTPQFLQETFGVSSALKAMFFALLAGFILNFMPCVFPVIMLKFSSIIAITSKLADEKEDEQYMRTVEDSGYLSLLDDATYESFSPQNNKRKELDTTIAVFKKYNIFFCLGILTFFTILGIFLHITGSIWGRLFQIPSLVLGTACIVFALALSIFDVFQIPLLSLRIKNNDDSLAQAFITGMLTTLLATPCSAPLLGGVLAWLVTQSINYYILIMVMIALGMSTPYIVFILYPKIIYKLPRPGQWNAILSRIVGLFLVGTTIYLLSLLPIAWLIPALITLFILTVVLWGWGILAKYTSSVVSRYVSRAILLIVAGCALYIVFAPQSQENIWLPFNEKTTSAMLGKELVVINFTADWCPNCKILEQTVLTHKNLSAWKKKYNATFILADITHRSPILEKLMQELRSSSIPLLVIFPRGEGARRPIVLRDLYTKANVEQALQRAIKSK